MAEPLADANVTLIHALSRGVWSAAATLGEQLDAAVVFRAADWSDADHAARLVRQLRPTRCVLVAASGPLAAELRRRTQNLVRVETVFPGVHVQVPRAGGRQPGDPLCVAVAGSGVLDDAYRALLSGIQQVVAQHPATQFFFDTPRTDPHRLWRETERRGLLGHVSFVPRRPGHRDLLLTADALVLPQATGRTRGVTLRAMARAVPVIAADDPSLDELTHDHTAWVLDNPDAAAWAEALLRVVATPDEANDLGLRARAWVHEERLASDQIGRLLNLYHTMTGEPIGFVGQGGALLAHDRVLTHEAHRLQVGVDRGAGHGKLKRAVALHEHRTQQRLAVVAQQGFAGDRVGGGHGDRLAGAGRDQWAYLAVGAGKEHGERVDVEGGHGPDRHAFLGKVFALQQRAHHVVGAFQQRVGQAVGHGVKHRRRDAATGGDNLAVVVGDGDFGHEQPVGAGLVGHLVRHVPVPAAVDRDRPGRGDL